MTGDNKPFWKTKTLFEMNKDEWEMLCDGCGKCCLQQLEDESTGQLVFTDIACDLFDQQHCSCTDYENRTSRVPNCMSLDVNNVVQAAEFAPPSCAYRLLALGEELPSWHPLRQGDRTLMHEQGLSAKNRCRSMNSIEQDKIEDYVVSWPLKEG